MLEKEIEIDSCIVDDRLLTSLDVSFGEAIPPLKRLQVFDADTWEDVTLELVHYWKSQYNRVVRCGGGGDMGRDVIAYNMSGTSWENYQCKHYSSKLSVAQALLEIGKVLYYAHIGKFSMPDRYYFVTPLGVSTDLLNHIMDAKKLKKALIDRWDSCCKCKITTKRNDDIELDESFLGFISEIDFSIFEHIPPLKLIEIHSKTPFHVKRFGTDIRRRPKPAKPPVDIEDFEITYTTELVSAFSDAEGAKLSVFNLGDYEDYNEEYYSARKNFFSAENLDKFSRDWLPEDSYQDLLEECYESISSVVKSPFSNGYERYLCTNTHSTKVDFSSHPLHSYIRIQDKKGMCQQLVNMKKIRWVRVKK
ncbi:TPA: ABC-three component system protein [Vibrio parahaemolyticus]